MGNVLVDLIPLMIGAAVVPVWVIIVLLLLRGENGITKAMALVGGATTTRLLQGVLFGYIFGASDNESESGAIAATLLLLIGILLWITAIKKWRKEEDPDAPPPKWMASIGTITPLRAFGTGAVLIAIAPKMWVFTLSALSTIQAANLSPVEGAATFLIFMVGAQSLLLIAIAIAALAPRRSGAILEAAGNWMEKNNRPITIAVSVIFGTYFLWKGISGLLA